MSSSNIYNILSKLNALQPKAVEPTTKVTKPIYESVEARGSIMSGVTRLEKKLSEQFAADKKALDTNPKNAAWDDDAGAKQRARIAREKQKIGMQRKISGMDTGQPPAMEDAAPVKYGVFSKGGSIGSQRFKDEPLKTFDSKEEAIADAKRRRSGLSKGERGYYRMSYVVKAIKGVAEAALRMSANTVPGDNLQKLASAMAATIIKDGWDNTFRSLIDFYDFFGDYYGDHPAHDVFFDLDDKSQKAVIKAINKQVKAATGGDGGAYNGERNPNESTGHGRGMFEQGVAEGEQGMSRAAKGYEKYGKEGMQALAKAGREGKDLDKVRNQYDKYDEDVTEGWDDMIKAGKERDAADRSGKKSTASGVKHHGKYGTEYQGDADEEEAAAKAADKGPKKRGRPAKGLAKPKPAAGEKKGRGRPKKAAEPTYSGAKDLQNYIVGNLPKKNKVRGTVHKMDESRMLDEAGQHLDHILNRFKHEVRNFEETGNLDQDSDLYHALHDYYKETGLLPYDVEKGRGNVSPLTWVADKLDDHLGISEELAPAGMAQAFKPGDRVLYMGTFATVITCDGETCGIKMDKHPGTMMVPVSQIKKPSYDESSSVPAQDTGKKDFFHNPAVPDNEQLPATPKEIELNELAKLAGLTTETKAKPDYIDLDKDGNKKEPMKSAAQDAEDDDHDYANRLDDEQMDENVPVHKHIDGPTVPGWTAPAADEFDDVCPECDGEGCPECYGDEHRDRAHDHARGMERESAIREAQEMINFMRNAGLDTSRAESALAEAYKYGDTDVEEAPEYANSPDEEIENVEAVTRQGDDLNREKKQFAGKPKAGDNPMTSESSDPLEAMGRRLMRAYESIKVVDEGMVDKVKGMFGKVKKVDGPGNLFNEPDVKADTRSYLKKSAKQPNGPDNVKNIFNK